jgi:hypothetical protein
MPAYNTYPQLNPQTAVGNFSPYNYQTAVPLQQPQQNQSGLMTIMVGSEEEMMNYPVAAGVTVLLISFNLGKFWLKSTSTNGVPQQPRIFTFDEKTAVQQAPQTVTREEFDSLNSKIDKLLAELGGNDGKQ